MTADTRKEKKSWENSDSEEAAEEVMSMKHGLRLGLVEN